MPITAPVDASIVATDVLPLVHTPPVVAFVSVVVKPSHIVAVPPMATGDAFTVRPAVVLQPPGIV
jgi:hypothetical protein